MLPTRGLDLPGAGIAILGFVKVGESAMLRFRVEGMSCQGCVDAVSRAVAGAAPGRPLTVTLATGEIEVGDGADPTAVAGAIESAGFTVAEQPGR